MTKVILNAMREYLRIIKKNLLFLLLSGGKLVEHYLLKKYNKDILDKYPPVFIIGAPRTGSTIFYLLTTKFWNISFINNFHCKLHKIPVTGALLSKILFLKKSNYSLYSYQGATKGLTGPSECGSFWYNWFPRERHYVPANELNQKKICEIRKIVNAMTSINQKSVFFKNMNCGQRIGALSEIFPEAIFIYCKREPLFVTQSLLLIREKIYGAKSAWWSIMPKEYSEIVKHSPERQVTEQVYYIEKQIEEDLSTYYNDRFYEVKYEGLIQNPEQELESLRIILNEKGLDIKLKCSTYKDIPNLPNGNFKKMDDKTFSKLKMLINEFYENKEKR